MKKALLISLSFIVLSVSAVAQKSVNLPDSIYSGKQRKLHVQGVVVKQKNGFIISLSQGNYKNGFIG